jgi:transposase
MEQTITMSAKEVSRYDIITDLIKKHINGTEAAKMLGLSVRQVKNIKKRVLKEGAKGLVHKNRGKRSNRALSEAVVNEVRAIIEKTYRDFGPTFAAEKLQEHHGIEISDEKLRGLMTDWGLWKPRPRKTNKEYRAWRERKEHYGEMEQFDGCYHKWFEDRAPECCLLASIDDAQGTITRAEFASSESVKEVFLFWKGYLTEHGKPASIYLDKYSTYKINHEAAKDNSELLTQFQRAAQELGIALITAHSPQAKGRIERVFETLQDRLVKELRLAGISTIPEANTFLREKFLQRFNAQFGVRAAKRGNVHRTLVLQEQERLPHIFSVHSTRTVANDFTIRFKNQWIQLEKEQPALVRRKETILIEEWLDGTMHVLLRGKELSFRVLPERPEKTALNLPALPARRSSWKPRQDHPWRKFVLLPSPSGRYQTSSRVPHAS